MSFGSQVKLVSVLALFTAPVIFALMAALDFAGAPLESGEVDEGALFDIAVALVLALVIGVIQIAAVGLIRLLPWQGPSLKVEDDDHLRRVFE